MVELLLRRTLSGLAAIDEAGQEFLRKVPIGSSVKCKAQRLSPRNDKRLRWWWAGIGLAHQNLTDAQRERWPTPESLHEAVKVALGFCEISYTAGGFTTPDGVHVPTGTLIVRPGSIAYAKLSEDEFAKLCDRFVELLCNKVLPNTQSEDLRREIENFVGMNRRAA